MALAIADNRISREDYLQGELASEIRHEYVAGNVYAMSGGTLNHQRIAGNFMRMAGNQLTGKPCFPTGSGFKLQVLLGGGEEAFYYPDGMIICVPVPGNALFTDSPSVILEVLSPTTRRNDEVQKFRDYLTIPSLGTYILAETESPFLTLHRRRRGLPAGNPSTNGSKTLSKRSSVGKAVIMSARTASPANNAGHFPTTSAIRSKVTPSISSVSCMKKCSV